MSLAVITESHLTDIADAIREKNGSTDTYTPGQMAAAIAAIPSGEQRYTIDNNGALNAITGDVVIDAQTIAAHGFTHGLYYCTGVTSVSFPQLVDVGRNGMEGAFGYCSGLHSVSFPELQTIQRYGMNSLFTFVTSGPTAVNFPKLTKIEQYGLASAFQSGCSNLASVTFPELVTTEQNAMQNAFTKCTALTSMSFPKLTSMHQSTFNALTFQNCSSLVEFHFRADMQSVVEASTAYSSLWGRGAGNATVYFDL